MDYIYSYLNDDVASREMHGSETNTAVVTVNAATNTISVDVKPISPSMLNVAKPTESGSYILQETISTLGEVSYSWATLEDYNQEVTQAIANLTQQLEQEKQERIESVQTEANVRELADTQLRTEFTSELAQEKQEREQAINEEAQRTDSMINQLNDNVQSGFNTINNVLTTSINNINNAILNESTIREEQFDDTTFRIRDINTRLGVEIDNRERRDAEIYANLSTDIANEKRERVEQDQDIRNSISIINGGLEEERQARATADETLQSNIDAEANERKSVDQHLWDILPDNIIAGTPMQGMENRNAINIVFSKYQKHGIGEDPADAELVEVPNQAITLFPATQEVAGVLTAADKTKIDNIATDIETAVQAEANVREEADNALSERITAIEDTNVLQSQILGNGRIQTTINSPAGRTFDIDVVDISNASNDDRFTVTLNNNDSISAMLNDGTTSVPLVFMSKWNKVEVGGSGAPLNLNSDDGKVTVNDEHILLDDTDKQELETSISEEITARTQADTQLGNRITAIEDTGVLNSELTGNGKFAINIQSEAGRTFNIEAVDISNEGNDDRFTLTLDNNDSISGKKLDGNSVPLVFMSKWDKVEVGGSSAPLNLNSNDGKVTVNDTYTLLDNTDKESIDTSIDDLSTRVENLEGKTTRLFYEGEVNPPSASDINTWVTGLDVEPKYEAPFEGIAVVVLMSDETYHIWHYYSNLSTWRDDGVDTVSTFTNDKKGIIQGSTNDGYVAAENGLGKVSGWDTVKTDITNLQNNLNSNVSNINQNIANVVNDLAANVVILGNAYTQANNAYTQANTAYTRANEAYDLASVTNTLATNANNTINSHIADTNNPHQVTAEQVGLGNVDNTSDEDKPISNATACAIACISACMAEVSGVATNANTNITTHIANKDNPHNVTKEQIGLSKVADVLQYSEENEPPYPVTSVAGRFGNITLTKSDVGLDNVPNVNTANASNINSGTLSRNIIEDGLIVAGANISVNRNSENGAYTISATTGGVVPVVSVAGKSGPEVTLNSITFNGAYNATYNGSSDITVTIPNVPSLHSVSLSTNNGSASTVIGNVYSDSATPIEISIPTISVVRGTPTGNGVAVVDIQVTTEGNVVTITPVLGPVNDGTL